MWSPREARVFKLLDIEGQAAKVELAPSVSQENMKILHVVRTVRPELVRSSSEFELVEISQYLPISQLLQSADLAKFDILLQGRNFLVGSTLSLADAVMYDAFVQQLSAGGGKNTASLLKKFTHLASYVSKLSSILKSDFQCSVPAADPSVSTDGAATATKKNKKEKPAAPAPEAAKSGDAASSDTGDALDPSKLDIRVGVVVKCWNHPESEKLLCEEIDLGEGSVRTIASGLRAHYAAEEVQGRQVLVLANLKERPMAGFLSQGMVLCACNEDHTVVHLLQPPEGCAAGDRVSFPGFSGEPATPAHVAKKKILEKLAPQLRTDSDGVACWADKKFTIESKGVCTAPLVNSPVS